MAEKHSTPSAKAESLRRAALRWHAHHSDQLRTGTCEACTALYKAIQRYARKGKRRG